MNESPFPPSSSPDQLTFLCVPLDSPQFQMLRDDMELLTWLDREQQAEEDPDEKKYILSGMEILVKRLVKKYVQPTPVPSVLDQLTPDDCVNVLHELVLGHEQICQKLMQARGN